MDVSIAVVALVAAALFAGGTAKGALGFGMPLVSLPIITGIIDVRVALPLMTMPILISNVWQAFHGRMALPVVQRYWRLYLAMAAGCALGALLFASIDPRYIFLLLGISVLAFVAADFAASSLTIKAAHERSAGIAAGFVGGVMGGVSTFFGPPIIMYFVALHLPQEVFIAALGITWLLASLLLITSYLSVDVLTAQLALLSLACAAPVFTGVLFGRWLVRHMSQRLLRNGVLIFLVLTGLNLIRRAVL